MRLPFTEVFGHQILVALLFLPICSRAVPVTYCSPELSGTSNRSMSIYMSNGYCQNICQGINAALFVILGTDCWCTDYVPANQVPTFQCNTPCPGYPPDSCGNTTSNLYAYFTLQRRPSGTASAFTIDPVPALPSAASNTAISNSVTSTSSPTTSGEETASATASSIANSAPTGSTASTFTSTDASDIALYLQTALPASARSQSSNACFLNSAYSYYSTPSWYEQLPTQVQSYYSSSAQGATAACTLSANQVSTTSANRSSGLSTGAKAGIAVGVIIAVLLIAALLFLCLRRRRRRRRNEAVTNGKADLEHEKAAIPATAYADPHPQPHTHSHYPTARSEEEDFTALPVVPPSAHMQSTHPAFIGAAQGRHKDNSIQSTPSLSDFSRDEQPSSKPWMTYANQRTRSEMSEDQQFFPALQQQNPYQLDPELDFGTYNNQHTLNALPRRPVGGVGQTVHAGGTTGGFGFSDHNNTGYESGGERSWYHAR